jgi:hypothetical protein
MKAFPNVTGAVGMELRDYFAAKIMQSILVTGKNLPRNYDLFAKDAYEIADLMMEERDK